MNRTPLIAGNWKMNTDVNEARQLAGQIRERTANLTGVEVVLCPPAISLLAVAEVAAGTEIAVGAQNCHFEDSGAFTGEISPAMLAGHCEYTILGHSERRQYFAETNELVGQKLRGALRHDLIPILCVGETLDQREQGVTDQVIGSQLDGALSDLSEPRVVVAYEPVWAIGTGLPATGSMANDVAGFIRERLKAFGSPEWVEAVRILYGGSVNAGNFAEYINQPDVDGALVGGASLKADDFARICELAQG
jgi:triosephosphate isomerase